MDDELKIIDIQNDNRSSLICYATFEYSHKSIPIVKFYVKLYRRSLYTRGYNKMEISYVNKYYDNPDFASKGYTKKGLNMLINFINEKSLCPYIILDIDKNNLASRAVALSNGFKELDDEKYFYFLDNAITLFAYSISGMGFDIEKNELKEFQALLDKYNISFTRS